MKKSVILLKFANYHLRKDHCHSTYNGQNSYFLIKFVYEKLIGFASLKYLIVSRIKIKRSFRVLF